MRTTDRQARENRTITVDFHDEATYFRLIDDRKAFVECVLAFLLALGFQLVWPKNSCSLALIVFQETAQPLTTKAARVFRRAQAVREVVAGYHVHAVSALFHFTNWPSVNGCSALPSRAPRACWTVRGPVDPAKSRASWNSTSIASLIKTPWSTGPSIRSGVAVHLRPS